MSKPTPLTILHVDDNATNRYVVARMLGQAGFTVMEAASGEAGLQAIAQQEPDLIILDVRLPGISGFEVCHHIKSNPATSAIPVLHLSASFVESRDKAYGLDSGADAYLAQPVEPIELLATVKSLLRIRQAEESALALAREWQTTFDSMTDGVGLFDVEGKVIRCNQALVKLLGKPSQEIIGCPHQELIPTEGGGIEIIPFLRVQETYHRESIEIKLKQRWFSVTVDPVLDDGGHFTGAVYILADITDRRRAEESLRFLAEASSVLANSLDYETTLKNVADLAVPQIADWCVVDILQEDRSIRRLAVSHQDASKVDLVWELARRYPVRFDDANGLGKSIRTQQPELAPEILDEMLVDYAQDEQHLNIMRSLGLQSCIIAPLIANAQVLGTISFVAAESARRYDRSDLDVALDLAHRAALAVQNARLYQEAREANRMKDEFLATLSHELRSPLNAMLGWLRLLNTRKFDEATTARAMETVERSARSQAQLVEDLLDVSRIIQGKLSLNIRPVELVKAIETSLETLRPAAEAKEIQLQADFDTTAGLVSGDADRLQQVIWNLLSNAIKFTPKGGRIRVKLQRFSSQAEIAITDTGRGINPEFVPYVFDRFRQADGSITRAYGGLGLGLAIVRHLIELHGGTVSASSEGEGKGATFTVRLPLMPVRLEIDTLKRARLTMNEGISPDGSINIKGVRILVVDDLADARDFIITVLEMSQAEVIAVSSAQEALEMIQNETFDILISDIGMPDEDGYSLIRKVRKLAKGRDLPAVALTAYARAEDRTRSLSEGFQMHLSKPVDPTELVSVVASLMKKIGNC